MIYDVDDNPLVSYSITVRPGSSFEFTIRCVCRTDSFLRSESVSALTVEGRLVGDPTWIDLETTGLDLTPWNGTRQNFEIKLTASNVDEMVSFKLYQQNA